MGVCSVFDLFIVVYISMLFVIDSVVMVSFSVMYSVFCIFSGMVGFS